MSSFFFYSYGDHRDLHSFPTRRSSDLAGHLRRSRPLAAARSRGRVRAAPARAPLRRPRVVADRKSTRLNSSHTVISYAVFCLKKKKKKQQRVTNGEEVQREQPESVRQC